MCKPNITIAERVAQLVGSGARLSAAQLVYDHLLLPPVPKSSFGDQFAKRAIARCHEILGAFQVGVSRDDELDAVARIREGLNKLEAIRLRVGDKSPAEWRTVALDVTLQKRRLLEAAKGERHEG